MVRRPSAGFSMVEAVIGSAILAVTAVGAGIALQSLARSMKMARASALRDRVWDRVNRAAMQPANLSRSADTGANAGNVALKNCLNLSGAADCTATAGWTPFVLHDAQSNGTLPPIAGDLGATPVLYDKDEQLCGALGRNCFIGARTWFRAECTGGAAACDQALTISVKTEVSDESQGLALGMGMQKRSSESRAPASVREMRGTGQKTCPTNTHYEGMDQFGNPNCVPNPTIDCAATANNFVNLINFNDKTYGCAPVQLSGSCPAGQYSKGYNANGTPICGNDIAKQIQDRVEIVVKQNTNFIPCPGWGLAVGLNNDGSPICERMHLQLGYTYYNQLFWGTGTWATGYGSIPGTPANEYFVDGGGSWIMKFIQPGNVYGEDFLVQQASCELDHDGWFQEDDYYGLCNCLTDTIKDNYAKFAVINWKTSPPLDTKSWGCSFNYVLVGRQNVY